MDYRNQKTTKGDIMCGWIVLAIIIINAAFLAIAIKNAKIID